MSMISGVFLPVPVPVLVGGVVVDADAGAFDAKAISVLGKAVICGI